MREQVVLAALVLAGCATTMGPTAAEMPVEPAAVEVTRVPGSLVPDIASVVRGDRIRAVTVGSLVFVRRSEMWDSLLTEHERVHVEQWQRLGPAFPLAYLLAVVLPGNWLEEEARERVQR